MLVVLFLFGLFFHSDIIKDYSVLLCIVKEVHVVRAILLLGKIQCFLFLIGDVHSIIEAKIHLTVYRNILIRSVLEGNTISCFWAHHHANCGAHTAVPVQPRLALKCCTQISNGLSRALLYLLFLPAVVLSVFRLL